MEPSDNVAAALIGASSVDTGRLWSSTQGVRRSCNAAGQEARAEEMVSSSEENSRRKSSRRIALLGRAERRTEGEDAPGTGGAHTIQAPKDTDGHGQPADRSGGRARRHGGRRLNSFWRKLNSIKCVAELVR